MTVPRPLAFAHLETRAALPLGAASSRRAAVARRLDAPQPWLWTRRHVRPGRRHPQPPGAERA